jgi:hypothetical protein
MPFGKSSGLALSGGGPRAALIGASMVNALDDKNPDAVREGVSQVYTFSSLMKFIFLTCISRFRQTGGIIQLVNYITGLSG